jgi:membrane-associated protease RseP (regulator of RpoE activity)
VTRAWPPLLALFALAASPAPERIQAIKALNALDQRAATIAYRLSTANTALCERKVPQTGMVLQELAQFGGPDRDAAAIALGLKDTPTIVALVPESLAAKAGLKLGDPILALDGKPIGPADPKDHYARIAKIEAAAEAGPVLLVIDRPDHPAALLLRGVPGCVSRVQVVPGRNRNAWSDKGGVYVQLTDRVAHEAADDNELAVIIAHEMAHNILGHKDRAKAVEIEADIFSLKLLKNAGYDPRAAARFWKHFGRKTGAGIFSEGTHQRTNARVAMLDAEAAKLTQ